MPAAWWFTFDTVLLYTENACEQIWSLQMKVRIVSQKSASIVFTGAIIIHAAKFLSSFLSKGVGIFFNSTPGFTGMNKNFIDITGNLPTISFA